MRIRPVVEILDRRALKPSVGDDVVFEGQVYVVSQVGMRWVHMYRKGDDRKFQQMARINQIIKVVPRPSAEAADDFLPPLDQ